MIVRLSIEYSKLLLFFMTIKSLLENRFINSKKKQIDLLKNLKLDRLQKDLYRKKTKILIKRTLLLYDLRFLRYYLEFPQS